MGRNGNLWTADAIAEVLAIKHNGDVFVRQCKTGATQSTRHNLNGKLGVFDAWAMAKSWSSPCCVGYEIKVARSDFLQDRKWQGYLPYCHEFAFVTPKGLIDRDELPAEVGLLEVVGQPGSPNARALTRKSAPYRRVEIPDTIYRYVLMNRYIECAPKQGQTDYWMEWLLEKDKKRLLGMVASQHIQKMVYETKRENERLRGEMEKYEEVIAICAQLGIDVHSWQFRHTTEDKLKAAQLLFPTEVRDSLRRMAETSTGLLAAIEKMEVSGEAAPDDSN